MTCVFSNQVYDEKKNGWMGEEGGRDSANEKAKKRKVKDAKAVKPESHRHRRYRGFHE